MIRKIGWVLFILLIFAGLFSANSDSPVLAQSPATEEPRVVLYFFWGSGCPYCLEQKPIIEGWDLHYPELGVRQYEVWGSLENRDFFFRMADAAGFEAAGVPATIIGDRVWVGFQPSMMPEMVAAIEACIQSSCVDYGAAIGSDPFIKQDSPGLPAPVSPATPTAEPAPSPQPDPTSIPSAGPSNDRGEGNLLKLPLLGTIDLNSHSLAFSTALIAFVDGFNPCSLWVLSILLALVIYSGSRLKTFIVGFTFLLVTALVYGLFIAGLFSVFVYIAYLTWVQVAVALIALVFALVNIKDYFWFKEGISFTISDKHRPKIFRNIRETLTSGKSIWALIGATVVMALGIALVELPCTAGFPVLWSNLVAAQNVETGAFLLLLGLYILIYLLDEMVIFISVVVTLKASKLEEKHGRVLKLIGGMLMLTLALVLLINPDLLNDLGSSILVFAGAFGATILVLILHRKVLPAFGIRIGSELSTKQRKARHK